MTKNAIVWTKKGSQECIAAINTLKSLGYTVEEKALKSKADIDAFKAAYPDVKTVPLIVVDGTVVGNIDAIGSLPEVMAARAAIASKASAQTPHTSRADAWETKKAATAASKAAKASEREARKAAWAANPNNIRQSPTGTREERHALKAEQIAATRARREAAQPVPPIAPQGYQMGAPRTATAEQKALRHEESVSKRLADLAANKAATAESRGARRATEKARIQAAIAARAAAHQ
jgi:glutaredoxin